MINKDTNTATKQDSNVLAMTPQDKLYVEIEGFTKADFNTDKPYLFVLNSHDNDDILYRRLKNKLLEQAKLVRYSATDAKEQMKAMEGKHKDLLPTTSKPASSSAGFPGMERFFGQEAVDYCGYDCSEKGIQTTNIYGVPVAVCPHPIFISKRFKDVSDKETPEEKVNITWLMDNAYRTLREIPSEKLGTKSSLIKALRGRGIALDENNASELMTFLTKFDFANRGIIPVVHTTRVIGWTDDKEFAPITGDVKMATFQKSDFNDIASSIGKSGDPAVWYDGVKKLRKDPRSAKARIAMAGAFASPMMQKLNFPPFWIHLEGKTGSAKTVVLRLCASIYAYTTSTGGYMRSMDNTDVGLELLAGFIRNMPLCLNEMQRIKDPKTLPKKVYMITEGSGRGRGNTDINLRESAKFYCVPISTGEKPLVADQDEGGAINRVIAIRVKDGDTLVKDAPQFCMDVLDKSWGHAAEPWINAIKDLDYDVIKGEVLQTAEQLKKQGKAEKQAIAAGIILVADRLAEQYIFHDGVRLTVEDLKPILKDDTEVDDRQRAYDAMCSLISENGNNFINGSFTPNGRVWGKIMDVNGDHIAFNADVFNEEMRKRGFDPSMFADWAIEKQIFEDGREKGDHKHKTVKSRIEAGKPPVWCWLIDMTVDPTGNIPTGFTEVDEELPDEYKEQVEQEVMDI